MPWFVDLFNKKLYPEDISPEDEERQASQCFGLIARAVAPMAAEAAMPMAGKALGSLSKHKEGKSKKGGKGNKKDKNSGNNKKQQKAPKNHDKKNHDKSGGKKNKKHKRILEQKKESYVDNENGQVERNKVLKEDKMAIELRVFIEAARINEACFSHTFGSESWF